MPVYCVGTSMMLIPYDSCSTWQQPVTEQYWQWTPSSNCCGFCDFDIVVLSCLFLFLFTALTQQSRQLGSLSTFSHRTHMCGELTSADVSRRVTVCGWLQHLRHSGLFLVLRDAYGVVQAVISNPEVIPYFHRALNFKKFYWTCLQ